MKLETHIVARAVPNTFNGELRRYHNWKTRTWLFGMLPDHWSPSGLTDVWTDDERLALADNGELAAMLSLGSGEAVAASMVSPHGTSGVAFTIWDLILEEVAGGTHASAVMCCRSQQRKGGCFDVVRSDGARVERREF